MSRNKDMLTHTGYIQNLFECQESGASFSPERFPKDSHAQSYWGEAIYLSGVLKGGFSQR